MAIMFGNDYKRANRINLKCFNVSLWQCSGGARAVRDARGARRSRLTRLAAAPAFSCRAIANYLHARLDRDSQIAICEHVPAAFLRAFMMPAMDA